jgi:hypothetical protein
MASVKPENMEEYLTNMTNQQVRIACGASNVRGRSLLRSIRCVCCVSREQAGALVRAFIDFPKPLIAAVNGNASDLPRNASQLTKVGSQSQAPRSGLR